MEYLLVLPRVEYVGKSWKKNRVHVQNDKNIQLCIYLDNLLLLFNYSVQFCIAGIHYFLSRVFLTISGNAYVYMKALCFTFLSVEVTLMLLIRLIQMRLHTFSLASYARLHH